MKTIAVLIDFDNIFPRIISDYQNREIEATIARKVIDKKIHFKSMSAYYSLLNEDQIYIHNAP